MPNIHNQPETPETSKKLFFDREDLLARLSGNEKALKMILKIAVDTLPLELDKLKTAIETGNEIEISTAAHTIKGMAANISCTPLQNAAAELDRAARSKDHKNIGEKAKITLATADETLNAIS